jgi:3-oxo-5-alpha-steroid 4-dehydrogenase 1
MNTVIFYRIVWAWIFLAVFVFIILLFISAPYGRYSSKNWGGMVSNRVSWILMEFPSLLIFSYFFFSGPAPKNGYSLFLGALWIIHYVHRSLVFPFRIKTQKKKMPLAISFMAVFFNLVNGYINGYYLGNIFPVGKECFYQDPLFISGALLFFTGLFINIQSDQILINLRKNGSPNYSIPFGGLFRFISCPNYFGEILEWLGYALMAWSLPALSFFIWTFANLVPRAMHYQKWYRAQFENYPENRKAIIPFLL